MILEICSGENRLSQVTFGRAGKKLGVTALPVTAGPGKQGDPLHPRAEELNVGSGQWLSPAPPIHTG